MKRALLLAMISGGLIAAEPPEPVFDAVTLDGKIQIGYGLAIADVDGDKAPDILLADKKQFVWYRNPGAAKASDPAAWTKHLLAENLTKNDNVCIAAQDIDGDGKCEIAVGAEWNPSDTVNSGAVFYLIPPADRTQPWEAVRFPAVEPTTHRMKWLKFDDKSWGLVVVPLHGRGNDAKTGEGVPVKVLCYRKPADVRGEWKAEVVDESMHMTHNFHFTAKWHQPMNDEILLAGKEGMKFARFVSGGWSSTLHEAGAKDGEEMMGAGEVRDGWLPGKRHIFYTTVEPMHGNRLVVTPMWAASRGDKFQRHVLTDQLADGHALACGDVLGVGSDQIVVGWRGNAQKPRPVGIKLFTPLDDRGEQWRESLVDDNETACEDLVLADLNGDGKLDIIAAGRATHNVKVYFNRSAAP